MKIISDRKRKEYEKFKNIFLQTLNKYASFKEKVIRTNEGLFMTKTLK